MYIIARMKGRNEIHDTYQIEGEEETCETLESVSYFFRQICEMTSYLRLRKDRVTNYILNVH